MIFVLHSTFATRAARKCIAVLVDLDYGDTHRKPISKGEQEFVENRAWSDVQFPVVIEPIIIIFHVIYTSDSNHRGNHMNCGSGNPITVRKCTPLRGEQQATICDRQRCDKV